MSKHFSMGEFSLVSVVTEESYIEYQAWTWDWPREMVYRPESVQCDVVYIICLKTKVIDL